MSQNEKIPPQIDKKSKIRERYKGIDESELDVIPAIPQEDFYHGTSEKRVAVYARVSTDDPRQTSSYELQKNHYTDLVSRRPDWKLIDIYADEGISGTSLQHRDEFLRMIDDCNADKIDLIVTKSVSRFARNIMDCIGYVRMLKGRKPPIGVFFETENIYTLDANSEMSLSFIATLAQEESHTKSEIMNASIEMRFKRGIFLTPALLGYDLDEDGNLIINEDEARTVRLIFFMYLYGYVDKYFPNAVSVVDSFHVVQWITHAIDNYIRALVKRYRQRDREIEEQKSLEAGRPVSLPQSDELYLLTKYRWLVLANRENITYHSSPRMDQHFRCLMNTYDYEDALFRISPKLKDLRDWKERYIQFNSRNAGHPIRAREEIEDLIDFYYQTGDSIFVDFAALLSKHREPIINSFVMVEKHGPGGIYDSRLSNGPIESLNRKVKDLKRLGRGFRNFEHFRNRFLYATRNNPTFNAVSDYNPVQYLEDDEEL